MKVPLVMSDGNPVVSLGQQILNMFDTFLRTSIIKMVSASYYLKIVVNARKTFCPDAPFYL